VEAFYVIGGTLAVWAVVVSFLGITRKDFPASAVAERAVAVVSLVLVLGAISAAIVGALNEEEHEETEGSEHAALTIAA